MDYLFIVNPVAGGAKADFAESVNKLFSSRSYEIQYTGYSGHAVELAKNSNASVVVAVGGDGTVNEVARGLIGTEKVLGIVPCGSGNGLAYHLGIPKDVGMALDVIFNSHIMHLDVGYMNGEMFLCTCGIGLDADVSLLFAKSKRRGLAMYVVDAIRAWRSFVFQECKVYIDSECVVDTPTLITIGNANQWGNNAYITPAASIGDGLLEVSVISRINLLNVPGLTCKLFRRSLYSHNKVMHFKGRTIDIYRQHAGAAHYDGEAISLGTAIHVEIAARALEVLGVHDG